MAIGVVSCDEENDKQIIGKWEITWQLNNDLLSGEVEFFHDQAIVRVKGHPGSPLLSTYEEMQYSWHFEADQLVLVPNGESLTMRYDIQLRQEDYLRFNYLDEITITMARL